MNAMPLMVVTTQFAKLQAALYQDAAGSQVIPVVFGLDTVHAQLFKGECQQSCHGFAHVAPAPKLPSQPVAE